jgi:hypothetical protein
MYFSEKVSQGEATPNIGQLREELALQLHLYPTTLSIEISDLMAVTPDSFDLQGGLNQAKTLLDQERNTYIVSSRGEAQGRAQSIEIAEEEFEGPKRYIKRRGLNNSLKPELREARDAAIKAAKDRIAARIGQEIKPENYEIPVNEAVLQESANDYMTERYRTVTGAVESVKHAMPEREVDPNSIIYRRVRHYGFSGEKTIDGPVDEEDAAERTKALTALKNALVNLRWAAQNRHVASHLVNAHRAAHISMIDALLQQDYARIAEEELAGLPEEIERAYAVAARIGPLYIPQIPAQKDTVPEEDPLQDQKPPQATEKISQEETIQKLGRVENIFSWSNGEELEISHMRTSEGEILFCTAMSSNALEISQKLRKDKKSAVDFNSIWGQILKIELSGSAIKSKNIRSTNAAASKEICDGHSLIYYRKIGPNARRSYYIKTTLDKYPSIEQFIRSKGYDPTTPLVVLLAETDKVNQLRTLAHFGVDPAHAKNRGAGSI